VRTSQEIPNLDDEELKQRLAPIHQALRPDAPSYQPPSVGTSKPLEQSLKSPEQTSTEPRRPRKGIEFLLPQAVVAEIKTKAAVRQISATTLILELLRDAGFEVEDDDFLDLRKLNRR